MLVTSCKNYFGDRGDCKRSRGKSRCTIKKIVAPTLLHHIADSIALHCLSSGWGAYKLVRRLGRMQGRWKKNTGELFTWTLLHSPCRLHSSALHYDWEESPSFDFGVCVDWGDGTRRGEGTGEINQLHSPPLLLQTPNLCIALLLGRLVQRVGKLVRLGRLQVEGRR